MSVERGLLVNVGLQNLVVGYPGLKGHNTQQSGHMGQHFQTEKAVEIQIVRPTEVCGKVKAYSEKKWLNVCLNVNRLISLLIVKCY